MPHVIKTIPLSKLLLDPENARFSGEEAASQREAIQLIIDSDDKGDGAGKLYALIEHIYQNGLDPTELIMVFETTDEVIVLEGNRRTAALKIIETPELFPSEKYRTKVLALKSKSEPADNFSEVGCSVIENRGTASKWLELKHVGQNDGAGRIGWSGTATDAFREKTTGKKSIGKQIRDFVSSSPEFDEYTKDVALQIRITNLTRLFSNAVSKKFFGYVSENNKLKITGDKERTIALMDYALRLFYDEGLTVTSIKRTPDIEAFYKRIKTDLPDYFQSKEDEPSNSGASDSNTDGNASADTSAIGGNRADSNDEEKDKKGSTSTSAKPEKKPRATPTTLSRKRLFNYSLKITEPRINELYRDLSKKVNVQDTPSICSAGFRVFIELSVDHYIQRAPNNQPITQADNSKVVTEDSPLRIKVLAVIKHLKDSSELTDLEAKASRALVGNGSKTDAIGSGSIEHLHLWVHSTGNTPRATDLNAIANDYKPLLTAIWK